MLDLATSATLRLHPSDNVAIALADLGAGTILPDLGVTLAQPVPRGHKIALAPIAPGANVIRYGQIIGAATQVIQPGEHVHSHNLGMGAHDTDYAFGTDLRPLPPVTEARHFLGYHRPDGQVGTRNYLGVLTSVNCSRSQASAMKRATEPEQFTEVRTPR
jgi:altronate hydrolase/galactarate dehydratase